MAHVEVAQGVVSVVVAVGVSPREVRQAQVQLPVGSTVRQALEQSGFMGAVPELDLAGLGAGVWSVGIWGRRSKASHVLQDGDRVEVVRRLLVDPKVARRERYRTQGEKIPKGRKRPSDWAATGESAD